MCEKTVLRNFGRMLCVVSLFAFVAEAAQITEDTTITVDADSEEDYDVSEGVTLTLSVASGSDYTLAGVISGQGSLRKEGAGVLKLSNSQNSISGGIYNNAGSLFAVASHAFGTSAITNYGSAMLVFDAQDGVFPNSIWATNTTSTAADPYQCPIQFRKNMELQGDITAVKSCIRLGNYRSSTSVEYARGPCVSITGKIKPFPGEWYGFADCLYGTNTLRGAIDASNDIVVNLGAVHSVNGILELESSENKWGQIQLRNSGVSCLADNVISNAAVCWWFSSRGNTPNGPCGTCYLNGHSQRIRSLEADANTFSSFSGYDASAGAQIQSFASATLTILGESSSRSACCRIQDDITVVLDAVEFPGFVQTISNRTCTTTGGLLVSNGTFRITGSASFPNVPNIYVGTGGSFTNASTKPSAFAGCRNLTVLGKMACTGDATPFTDGVVALTLGAGAGFSLPAGATVTVHSLKVGGSKMPDGTYGDGGTPLSQILQGTVTVRNHDRYVDCVSGSDSNDGSEARPYKTIKAATDNALSGDIIHVAPGTYGDAEGSQPISASSTVGTRVIVPENVVLESTGGAEKTFIVGASATGDQIDYAKYGTGANAVRCVYAKDGAVVRGFTLTGGRATGNYDNKGVENNSGSAFFSSSLLGATIEDCIVSNNAAYWMTIKNAVVRRSRVFCNVGLSDTSGAAGSYCSWYDSIIDCNSGGGTLFRPYAFENCTVGAANVWLGGAANPNVFYKNDGETLVIMNSAILGGTFTITGGSVLYCTNSLISSTMSAWANLPAEQSYNCLFTNSAAAQVDSEYRPILGSFVGIDAGDAAYSTEALGDTDAYGTPRVLNVAIDMGAVEYDWRPTFAHEIGRRFKVTYASPSVTTNTTGGLLLGAGCGFGETALPVCVAGTVNIVGLYEFKFNMTGGSVEVYVGGVLAGEASGTGEKSISFNVANTDDEICFVYTPDAENPCALLLSKFASARGFCITIW